MSGPCARVTIGGMRRHYIIDLGLTRAALIGEALERPIISMEFMLEHFGSLDGYTSHQTHFRLFEEEWHDVRVYALLAYIISCLYISVNMDYLNVEMIMAVRGLRQDPTILPIIFFEAFTSLSYGQTLKGHDFHDSSILLYIWCMSHIGPICNFRH